MTSRPETSYELVVIDAIPDDVRRTSYRLVATTAGPYDAPATHQSA